MSHLVRFAETDDGDGYIALAPHRINRKRFSYLFGKESTFILNEVAIIEDTSELLSAKEEAVLKRKFFHSDE